MYLYDYVIKIHELTNISPEDVVLQLFYTAGKIEISPETARKWMSSEGRYKKHKYNIYRHYFDKERPFFNDTKFIKYLRDQTENRWEELQKSFVQISDAELIDTETNNKDLFYQSLLRQFQSICALQLSPITPPSQNNSDCHLDNAQSNEQHSPIQKALHYQHTSAPENTDIQEPDFSAESVKPNIQPQSKALYAEFYDSFKGYTIKDFLDRTPENLSHSYLIRDAFEFANHIRYIHKNENCLDKESAIYKKIIKANNLLYDYLAFLQGVSSDPPNFLNSFEVKNNCSADCFEKAEQYCEQLKALYQEINIEIEKIRTEEHQKLVHTIKKEDEKIQNWRLSKHLNDLKKQ